MNEMDYKARRAMNAFTMAEGNQTRAAELLGVPRTTYMGWMRHAIDNNIEPAEGLEDIRREITRIYKQHEFQLNLARDNSTGKSFMDDLRHAVFNLPKPSVTPPRVHAERHGSPKVACLDISDVHMGEVIDLQMNTYNKDIAARRIMEVVEKFILHYSDADRVVLVFGGDNISGSIHQDLALTNEGFDAVCMMDCLSCFREVIKRLRKYYSQVDVVCVYGNHSRQTPRPWAKASHQVNWDWLMYCLLEKEFVDTSGIIFHIANCPDISIDINGYSFFVTHGDYFPGGGGGAGKFVGKVSRMRELVVEQTPENIDYCLLHHFHQALYISNPGLLVNPSICGVNEFALYNIRVKDSPAGANAWYVEKEHGLTDYRMLKCQ